MTGPEVKALNLPRRVQVKNREGFIAHVEVWRLIREDPSYRVPVSYLSKSDADITQLAAEDCARRADGHSSLVGDFLNENYTTPCTFRKFREEAHHIAVAAKNGDLSKLEALILTPKRDEMVWQQARELCARRAEVIRFYGDAKKYRTGAHDSQPAVQSTYDSLMELKNTGDLKGPDHG